MNLPITSRDEIAAKEEAARYQLTYSRRPETDMEVCMPMQRLQSLANGEGLWANIPEPARRDQLRYGWPTCRRNVSDLPPFPV